MKIMAFGQVKAAGGVTVLDAEVTKPDLSPVPIWRCKNNECKAWMREELAASPSPECPLCKGGMLKSIKHLPKLVKKKPRKKP
ncbi:cold-inducible protein YdjO-related protein [Paenibacillus sp. GCM10023248]|uniref:cold-inducible protein YdjO-related protein n=1 Tax=Bacillus sp. 3255 TaxID=2817904 RepID=UPI00286CB5E9|nr:cold-inducible protein YdjO-related protein [Bacillus sp. 3255]MDD9266571.1 cold-inducible protein YdjO-related protein [Paenibacillus sp. MAHUQ-63]